MSKYSWGTYEGAPPIHVSFTGEPNKKPFMKDSEHYESATEYAIRHNMSLKAAQARRADADKLLCCIGFIKGTTKIHIIADT